MTNVFPLVKKMPASKHMPAGEVDLSRCMPGETRLVNIYLSLGYSLEGARAEAEMWGARIEAPEAATEYSE